MINYIILKERLVEKCQRYITINVGGMIFKTINVGGIIFKTTK